MSCNARIEQALDLLKQAPCHPCVSSAIDLLEKELMFACQPDVIKEKYIVFSVEKITGFKLDEINRKTRKIEVVYARHCLRYLLKQYTGYTLKAIGKTTGGCHHSTVLNSIEEYSNIIAQDEVERAKYERLVKEVEECLA
jgi:chromosomal replication initiation ATPase DnaA